MTSEDETTGAAPDRPEPGQTDPELTCHVCDGTGVLVEPSVMQSGRRMRGHLERGWRKRWLILQLAKGDLSVYELGRVMNCRRQNVERFAERHRTEIEEAVRRLEDEFVGLWVADKANRLAEYQQDIEDANEIISGEMGDAGQPVEPDPLDPGDIDGEDPAPSSAPVWVGIKQRALRAVAEELGQIPNRVRMDVGGQIATYRIEGVDLDKV